MQTNIVFPLLLTLLAGLATVVGSLIAFVSSRTNRRLLSFSLGLSAGVMIFVSFVELFADAQHTLTSELGIKPGMWVTLLCFFGGILLIGIIDKLVPSYENPHEARALEDLQSPENKNDKLMRMGVLTSLAIAIHNFPEGIATFMAAVENPTLGMAIAVAIAIHNIPEGIAVSIPVYFATGNRAKAFWISFLSGIAEPVGALIAYIFLLQFMSPFLMGCVFAVVAGIMVFISLDELLPAAHEYGEYHVAIYGLIAGMAVMAVSLILLA
ncbi:MAG: zinc transporter ZupT [Tannerella sp.]|jgi:ZIP family zinc transporter|nr:zinc transporter ZupT [Tannerella sp.]